MKKLLLIALPLVVFLASCSKDQKVVKQLEGDWKVTAMNYNGVSADKEDFEGVKYSFEKCKVSKEDCNGKVAYSYNGASISFPFTYSISDKGETFTMKTTFTGGSAETQTAKILEHSKTKFVFKSTDSDGDTSEVTLEKI